MWVSILRGLGETGCVRGENGGWCFYAGREKWRMEPGIAVCVIRMFLQRKQVLFAFDSFFSGGAMSLVTPPVSSGAFVLIQERRCPHA